MLSIQDALSELVRPAKMGPTARNRGHRSTFQSLLFSPRVHGHGQATPAHGVSGAGTESFVASAPRIHLNCPC
jgi:hypothetical protein